MKNLKDEIEGIKDEFNFKRFELKFANDFQENGESGAYEFGFKVKLGNEAFTVTDWGNIWRFFETRFTSLIEQEKERAVREFVNYIIVRETPVGAVTVNDKLRFLIDGLGQYLAERKEQFLKESEGK